MNKIKNFAFAVGALSAGVAPSLLLAQEVDNGATITIPTLVNTTGLQASMVETFKNWIVIGLAIGLGVFAVYFGWKLIRRFVK